MFAVLCAVCEDKKSSNERHEQGARRGEARRSLLERYTEANMGEHLLMDGMGNPHLEQSLNGDTMRTWRRRALAAREAAQSIEEQVFADLDVEPLPDEVTCDVDVEQLRTLLRWVIHETRHYAVDPSDQQSGLRW